MITSLIVAYCLAQPAQADPVKEQYRPSVVPQRVQLTLSGDPATSRAVTWVTDRSVVKPVAQIATDDASPSLEKYAATVEARTETVNADLGWQTAYHTATFSNLKPKTSYVYRVGDGKVWSEWYSLKTSADRFEPFNFIYMGDIQNGIKPLWSRVVRRAVLNFPETAFLLYGGDIVNNSNSQEQWCEVSDGAGWVNATIPTIAASGNHEHTKNKDGLQAISDHWRPRFEFPLNGPEGLEESCYFIDYQGVRFIVLNSTVEHQKQTPWLEEKLKNNPCRWTILCFHHPIFSTAKGRDNAPLRALWKPIIDKYGVDLVLQGHDHTYGRNDFKSVKKLDSEGRQVDGGTVYVVSVSGSKQYVLEKHDRYVRAAEQTQLYQNIRIEKDRLKFEAYLANGELYDGFTLVKQPGKSNKLVDQKPKTPDRVIKASSSN